MMTKGFGLYVLLLAGGALLTVCELTAQNINTEISTYDLRSDELPLQSRYELFEFEQNPLSAYLQLQHGYMPINHAFHGRRDERVVVGGIDLADGINTSTVHSVAIRLCTTNYTSDTLKAAGEELYGRRLYALNPFTSQKSIAQLGVVALAGRYSGGVNGRFAAEHRGMSYDVKFNLHGGPSVYGSGVDSYGGFLSTAIRKGGVSVLFAVAPSVAGCRTASTDEAFALTGRRFYNPSTGWDGGRLRNARVRRECIPTLLVGYNTAVGRTLNLNVAVMGRYGAASRSGLDWYNGISPYPDHYRALPSGMNNQWAADKLRELWRQDATDVTGIDWQALRKVNSTSRHAMYLLASQVERVASLGGRVGVSGRRANCTYRVGVEMRCDNSAFYKRIDDLLGASHALNIDYFESELSIGQVVYNDAANAGQRLGVGDRSDYNFVITRSSAILDGDLRWRRGGWQADVTLRCGVGTLSRRGLWHKSSHTDSFGTSRVHLFADSALELALQRKWNTHSAGLKAWGEIRPLEYRNLYLSPENSSAAIPNPFGRVDRGVGAVYRFKGEVISTHVAVRVAESHNRTEIYRYYDDIEGCYADMHISSLSTFGVGVDLSVECLLGQRWSLSAAASWLHDVYSSNPLVSIYRDIDGEVFSEKNPSYLKGLRTGSTPMFSALCEVSGRLANGWQVRGSIMGFGGRFVEPNPLYRMERTKLHMATPEDYSKLSEQKCLGNTLSVEVNVSKYFEQAGIVLFLSVDGLVAGDQTYYAYEQMRLRRTQTGYIAAPLKRLYSMPVTAALSISFTL